MTHTTEARNEEMIVKDEILTPLPILKLCLQLRTWSIEYILLLYFLAWNFLIQAYLRYIAGLVPDHQNKVYDNKESHMDFCVSQCI